MNKAWLILTLIPLGCSQKPIQCDAHGMIIVPADATIEQQNDYNARNGAFINRRADNQLGRGGHYTAEPLDKATGCP